MGKETCRIYIVWNKQARIQGNINLIVCHVSAMGRALAFRADGPGSIPGPA